MRCDALSDLIDLYIDGELPAETARKVDRHLLKCPSCAYEVRTLEQTRSMLCAAMPRSEPSPAFRERAAAHLADALADRMKPVQEVSTARQWTLPLLHDEPERMEM